MGADVFMNVIVGKFKDANEAFNQAVKDAQYEHGHGGYTGTIAEKGMDKLELAPIPPKTRDVVKYVRDNFFTLTEKCDKWGAVKYVEITNKALLKRLKKEQGLSKKRGVRGFVFYGMASC